MVLLLLERVLEEREEVDAPVTGASGGPTHLVQLRPMADRLKSKHTLLFT